ncbi:phosphoribosylglycinamide formyltransferase [Anaerolineales bacterium]
MSNPLKILVLASGVGSNFQAIIDAIHSGSLSVEILALISNRKNAYALQRAAQAGIPHYHLSLKPYLEDGRGRALYDQDLAQFISQFPVDLILLAGWMHILDEKFIQALQCPIINLHPALPGAFPGTQAIQRAFEAYQKGTIPHSGCMIHHVIPEIDAGTVIKQRIVPIHPDDTLATFEQRMHLTEHELIVEALQSLHPKDNLT